MATGRQRHHVPDAAGAEAPTTAKERMAAKVQSPEGRALYARRKVIVEPVFGQIKEARGFRRFLLRGLANIRGAWSLGCVTHNLRKLWRYACTPVAVSANEQGSDVPRVGCCSTTLSSDPTVVRRHGHDVSAKHTPYVWIVSLTGDR